MIPVFYGEIKHGKICLYQREDFAALIQSLDGKRVEIILRRHKEKRSGGQNRLYWGCYIKAFAEFTGYTEEETHDALKMMFLRRTDGPFETVRSTASLSTDEFTEYLQKIDRLALEQGVCIPALASDGYA